MHSLKVKDIGHRLRMSVVVFWYKLRFSRDRKANVGATAYVKSRNMVPACLKIDCAKDQAASRAGVPHIHTAPSSSQQLWHGLARMILPSSDHGIDRRPLCLNTLT